MSQPLQGIRPHPDHAALHQSGRSQGPHRVVPQEERKVDQTRARRLPFRLPQGIPAEDGRVPHVQGMRGNPNRLQKTQAG